MERVWVDVVGSVTVAKRGTKAKPAASITVGPPAAAPAVAVPPLLLVLVVVVLVGLPPCGGAPAPVAGASGGVLPDVGLDPAPPGPPVVLICT